ncbi:unnamed protein product [Rotaria socialis]|uniref:Proteasome subunit beta n=1 Tax=Rotaria socialis TaxID=392032 RepID=A0A818AEM9_9BILA|nr:unnamed protein product [Rotaria socialis]
MLSEFNSCQPCLDTINDKDAFNINNSSNIHTIIPLEADAERNIRTRTVTPIVTGSSVVAFTFNGGVILAADTLGSYGSLAKYRNISRIHQVNEKTVLAVGGDLSDADYIKEAVDSKVEQDTIQEDGGEMTPLALYTWSTRLMYHRRTKLNPLLTSAIVAGMENKEFFQGKNFIDLFTCRFLGRVNDKGSGYKEFLIITGIDNHLAQYRVVVITNDGVEFKAKEVQPDWCLAPLLHNTE